MALHLTPQQHDADPPAGWTVHKSGRAWHLKDKDGNVIDTFPTKKAAEEAKTKGFAFDLYQKEGDWFSGNTPHGWKPYAQCKPEMDKAASVNRQTA